MSTRGASACVRNTPTGLPLCTSSVSSFSSARSAATIASNASQLRAALPGAAVHDEIVGPLGDLGVEVVHQHAQRGFLLPALAGDASCRAARARRSRRGLAAARSSNVAGTASDRPCGDRDLVACDRRREPLDVAAKARDRARAARRACAPRACARATPRPGLSGARQSMPLRRAHQLDREHVPHVAHDAAQLPRRRHRHRHDVFLAAVRRNRVDARRMREHLALAGERRRASPAPS